MQAYSANDLYRGLAVNSHLEARQTPYGDSNRAIACVKALGFPLLRDCAYNAATVAIWKKVADATGVKFIAYQQMGQVEWMRQSYANTKAFFDAGLLACLEGGNEEDSGYATGKYLDASGKQQFTPNSIASAQALQKELWAAWNARLPIINMSVGAGWEDPKGHYDDLGDMSAVCHYSNAHTYPQNKQTVGFTYDLINPLARMTAPSRPIAHTEFGYHTYLGHPSGVPEDIQAIYLAQAMLSFIPKGVSLWGIFELIDQKTGAADSEMNFGLFRSDYTPKPGVAMLSGIAGLMKTAKPVTPKPLDATITGLKSTHRTFLYQLDETKYALAVWREEPLYDSGTKKDLRTGARDIVTANFPNARLKAIDANSWGSPVTATSLAVTETPTLLMLDVVQAKYTEADLDAAYRQGVADVWKAIDGVRGKV